MSGTDPRATLCPLPSARAALRDAYTVSVPTLDYFRCILDYTVWARGRVLDAAARLTDADYQAPRGLDHGSIHTTLVHTFAAEALWRQRWLRRDHAALMSAAVAPDLTTLRRLWTLEDAKRAAFLDGLADADTARRIEYVSGSGVPYTEPLWQHLTQIVVHGAQHRSEVALALTQLGQSPGFLDFMAFARERG